MPFTVDAAPDAPATPPPQGFTLDGPPVAPPGKSAVREAAGKFANWLKGAEKLRESEAKSNWEEFSQTIAAYQEELKKDLAANPEGWGPQVVHGVQTFLKGAGMVWSPASVAVQKELVEPIQGAVTGIGDTIQKHLDARKKGDSNWALHKEDVQTQVDNLNELIEAAIQTATGFVGGESGPLGRATRLESRAARAGRTTVRAADAIREAPRGEVPPREAPKGAPEGEELSLEPPKEKPHVQIVGKTPEGKPRVRLMTGPAEAQLSKATNDLFKPVAAREEPVPFDTPRRQTMDREWVPASQEIGLIMADARVSGSTVMAHDILDRAIKVSANTEYIKEFLIKLRAHIDNVPIKVLEKMEDAEGQAALGLYYPMEHKIELTPKGAADFRIVAHELVHAATIRYMLAFPTAPLTRQLTDLHGEAQARFERWKEAERKSGRVIPENVGHYGLENPEEFVAEAMTRPVFQRFLAASDAYASKGWKNVKNLYSRLAHIIRQMLGIQKPQEAAMLHEVMGATTDLMEMQQASKKAISERFGDYPESLEVSPSPAKLEKSSVEVPGERTLSNWIDYFNKLVNVEGLGQKAKEAAAVIGHRIAVRAREDAYWKRQSKPALEFWRANPDKVREFLDYYELGAKFKDPTMEALKQRYKKWAANIADRDRNITGLEYADTDNYIPHLFEDADGVRNYLNAKYGRKWGDPGFIKDRSFPTIREAVEAGYRLKYNNPEEMMLARQAASDLAETRQGILEDLANYGLAVRAEKGVKVPAGYQPVRGPNGKTYWLHDHAYAVLNNAFSPGLWADKTPLGQMYRGMMNVKNATVSVKLSASAFHALHVLGIDQAAVMSNALEGLLTGSISAPKALGRLTAGALLGPFWKNPRMGGRLVRAFDNPDMARTLTASELKTLQLALEGGMTPHLNQIYKVQGEMSVMDAIKNLSLKTTYQLPLALMAAARKPLFEIWIPNLKMAAFARDAETALKMNPELEMNDLARKVTMRRIAKSIDNRYGEMNYNMLFWNRYVKDLMVLNTLSLGWQLGFLREYGGGALDAGRLVGSLAKGEGKAAVLRGGALHKPLFLATYTGTALAYGGLMTYLVGQAIPQNWRDYVYPVVGKNPDGSPKRVNTMFYTREFPAIATHMDQEGVFKGLGDLVASKGSGMFGLMHDWVTNMDTFGDEISDPNAPWYQRTAQKVGYSLQELEPISMRAIDQQMPKQHRFFEDPVGWAKDLPERAAEAAGNKETYLNIAGFSPLPKYLERTRTQNLISNYYREYVKAKATPYDKALMSKDMSALRAAWATDESKADAILNDMQDKYKLSYKDQQRILRDMRKNDDPSISMFKRLEWPQQKQLLDQMTREERETYLPHAKKDRRREYEEPTE